LNTLVKMLTQLPEVIDLFSGCGGLSYGFKTAGYTIAAGMEINKPASITASYNLHWKEGIDKEHCCTDITKSSASVFSDMIKGDVIVIGGPPCQAYSRIGKAKLKSLGESRNPVNDSRGYLYEDFIRYAVDLNANAVIMENVVESVNYDGKNIPQHVCELLESKGYNSIWTILNAADYGVPQTRERIFVIAIKKKIGNITHLPVPTHRKPDLSVMTQNELRFSFFSKFENFKMPNKSHKDLPVWVTVRDAFSDLPVLFPTSTSKYTLYKPNIKLDYKTEPVSDYQRLMRKTNKGFSSSVSGNGYRKTVRDFRIFENMNQDDDFRAAVNIAKMYFSNACNSYNITEESDPVFYNKLKKDFVPPYDTTKFLSKWKRLSENKPSHTLVAHLSTDTYSHIHPWEPRGISVREAARLQSFPDDFLFSCSMGDAFKQIGNAVPPLLSKAVAEALFKNISKILG
jgi:DNA (cytosine-5)-methyltransferase 1